MNGELFYFENAYLGIFTLYFSLSCLLMIFVKRLPIGPLKYTLTGVNDVYYVSHDRDFYLLQASFVV